LKISDLDPKKAIILAIGFLLNAAMFSNMFRVMGIGWLTIPFLVGFAGLLAWLLKLEGGATLQRRTKSARAAAKRGKNIDLSHLENIDDPNIIHPDVIIEAAKELSDTNNFGYNIKEVDEFIVRIADGVELLLFTNQFITRKIEAFKSNNIELIEQCSEMKIPEHLNGVGIISDNEIREIVFTVSREQVHSYDKEEVRIYLNEIANSVQHLLDINENLNMEMKTLREQHQSQPIQPEITKDDLNIEEIQETSSESLIESVETITTDEPQVLSEENDSQTSSDEKENQTPITGE